MDQVLSGLSNVRFYIDEVIIFSRLTNYYQRFVKNFSIIAKSLSILTIELEAALT
uniref:Uncharacterized protein n=1 Tax=Physcomitrium patens TaxID=3218 RepID=A0A2K1J1R0_PHYPA|nr:hypothetical protein PHYPA_023365 [Physcomitrium patens]